nr:retrovirus-related Pol polyprotein LINE-1 [Tanacetum cinerariifolium]
QGHGGVPGEPVTDPRRRFEWALGAATEGYACVHGGFRYGARNEEGRAILDFATAHDFGIVNSHFKKRDHHLLTFQSRGRCTKIDYLLVRRGDLKACKECRVFPREAYSSQHSLQALDVLLKRVQRRREKSALPRILWKNLMGDATEEFRYRVAEGVLTRVEALAACDAGSMLNTLASIIKDAAKDTLGVAIRTSKTHTARMESLWLCEEVQSIIAMKQAWFQELLSCQEGNEEERLGVLERDTSVFENQFGFMPGRSSVEAIHLIRSLIEKYRERQRDLHMDFLDLGKAYNNVPMELIWKTLVDKGTSRRYIRVIRGMYNGAKTHVRTSIRSIEFFPVDVGLHQGSTISPYLFALILDELSRGIQEDIPWCLIFADDIVLVSESTEGLNTRLENWRKVLEDNGLRVSREKTEYLRCDFGIGEIALNEEVDIRIGEKILQPKDSFRYLGSMLHKSGRIDEDVTNRIKAAWMKWRAATGVLCDRNVPLKLKGKFYRVAVRPAMLYGSECWPTTKALANRVEVAELRMLRWTCGKTLFDMISNGVYRAQLEVESIINKIREVRLRWFGHVRRIPQSALVRRVEALVVDGLRRRGRPKLRWEDRVKHDMKELLLSEDMTSDRNEWRARIRLGG